MDALDLEREQLFETHNVAEEIVLQEDDKSVRYRVGVRKQLGAIKNSYCSKQPSVAKGEKVASKVEMPALKCQTFDGRSSDKWQFHNFLCQFQNCLSSAGELTNESKFSYLLSFLDGVPLDMVRGLPLSNQSYDQALDKLKRKYLDIKAIKRHTFDEIIDTKLSEDCDLESLVNYISKMQSLILELAQQGVDFTQDNPGREIVSRILVRNLPSRFKVVLINKIGHNYPTLVEIFNKYEDIIETLNTTAKKGEEQEDGEKSEKADKSVKRKKQHNSKSQSPPDNQNEITSSLQNFHIEEPKFVPSQPQGTSPNPCKFCYSSNHATRVCTVYTNLEQRRKRCKELKLCSLCTGKNHETDQCPGKRDRLRYSCRQCQTHSHNAAMCDKERKTN